MNTCATLLPMVMDHRAEQEAIAAVFHERLHDLMSRQGLDPKKGEHLAQFVRVSKGTGYNWLSPGKTPSARALRKIAEAFNSSTDYLLGLTDDPGPPRRATGAGSGEGTRRAAEALAAELEAGADTPQPPVAADRRRHSRRRDDSPPRA